MGSYIDWSELKGFCVLYREYHADLAVEGSANLLFPSSGIDANSSAIISTAIAFGHIGTMMNIVTMVA
jgi:hypothetical protein